MELEMEFDGTEGGRSFRSAILLNARVPRSLGWITIIHVVRITRGSPRLQKSRARSLRYRSSRLPLHRPSIDGHDEAVAMQSAL
jgi:hypothetical protein